MKMVISGIQQMGIGVPNMHEGWKWYRKAFGMDIKVFEEAAEAGLMLPYTGGKPHKRHAALALNLQSGGGFEIWQYTSRTPQPAAFDIQVGDLGFFAAKIKSVDVAKAFDHMKRIEANLLTGLVKNPAGNDHFFMTDPYGNIFEVTGNGYIFKNEGKATGGAFGACIGVSDMERSMKFYADILGYDTVVYRQEGVFDDMKGVRGGEGRFARVLLRHSKARKGPFSQLLGPSEIELFQALDRAPRRIFENRYWGDLGFIHLCFDIQGMAELKRICEASGHPFTVDSANSFDMGEAAGHFTYIEDPDGALIEFVETHKVPIMKKIGWYINLKNRNPEKSLPTFLLKAFAINRVKE